MEFKKTYFLPPTSDFLAPPPDGPLSLGSILTATSTPHRPLNAGAIVPIPDSHHPTRIFETNWRKTISTSAGRSIGIFAQFLQAVGFAAELSVDHSKTTSNILAFNSLITDTFDPTSDYVREAIKASPAVKSYTQPSFLGKRKALYLVTGLKIVNGAQITYSLIEETGRTGKLGVDLTVAGAPGVQVGPTGRWSKKRDDETSLERAADFVFAFRVMKVSLKRKEQIQIEEYNEGAFLGLDDGEDSGGLGGDDLEIEDVAALADGQGQVLNAVDEVDGEAILVVRCAA